MTKRYQIRGLAALALALALPAGAQTLDLALPQGAEMTVSESLDFARLALPKGPFQNGAVPVQRRDTALFRAAYRLPLDGQITTQILSDDLRGQLAKAGYKIKFDCQASECGGFDFRFALDLLPEPDMHVDLGDFSYIHAEKGAGEDVQAVALLVSKSRKFGFVHVAEMGKVAPKPKLTEASMSPAPVLFALGQTTVLDGVTFASGQAVVQGIDGEILPALARWLGDNPAARAKVIGHTDSMGAAAANMALSKARAQTMVDILVQKHGIDPARLTAVGQGGDVPIATNDTAEGRAKNRRVEVVIGGN